MDGRTAERINEAKERLRAAILFGSWNDVRLALEALEEIDRPPPLRSAFFAAQGGCEFCPADGGGCGVCGTWN
jgi:hypothetical protein